MATLTGYKAVRDAAPNNSSGAGGRPNPVFVFDEAEPIDRSDESQNQSVHQDDEQYADAKSNSSTTNNNDNNAPSNTTTIDMVSAGSASAVNQPTARKFQKLKEQQQQQQDQQRPASTTPPEQRLEQSRLTPNGTDGASMSVLSIDCQGSGKSPRTPRRSPLMALFRGKPRESTKRTYSDEDQFEIEWADLSLQVQEKFSILNTLKGFCCSSSASASSSASTSVTQQAADLVELKAAQKSARMILNNVDGRIKSGEITAVLGPSGAGKTSLLNGLFGKYRTAVTGSIKVTGAPTKKHLTVCTIPQSDYLIGYLTTEESLWFASRLKNCEQDFNHDRNIERVIELLGLQRCRHTRINKLSGGQYKRVSIAQEMLSSPDILVLDEPTSGLDSLTCYRTVKVLRDLVEASKAHNLVNPMSIVLTIHQPHREVLDLFHSVYVMAVGGQTLFHGAPSEMEDTINNHSNCTMPAQGYNPASFMVEVASEEYGRETIDRLVNHQRKKFAATTKHVYPSLTGYKQTSKVKQSSNQDQLEHETSLNNLSSLSSNHKLIGSKDSSMLSLFPADAATQQVASNDKYVDVDLKDSSNANYYKVNAHQQHYNNQHKDIDSRIMTPRSGKNSDGVFFRHVSLMARRCFLSNTRDPLLFTIRTGAHIFIPLVVALIYGPTMGLPNGCPFYKPEINLLEYASIGVEEIQEKHDDIRVQFQNVGLHFMVYYAFGLCMLAFTAISFPLIMHVLIKEIRNGWYSLATFIIGKMLAELPMAIILPPISVGIIYTMTGQPSSYLQWRYMVQSVILILIVMIAEAKGLIFGAVCMNSMQTSVFAASVSTVPFILLSGFLIRIREVPYVLQHFAQFSYFKHSVEALIITRYGFGMCPCDQALIPPGGVPRIIGVPPQIMSLTDYYINAYDSSENESSLSSKNSTADNQLNVVGNNRNVSKIIDSITTLSPEVDNLKLNAEALVAQPSTDSNDEEPETTTVFSSANTDDTNDNKNNNNDDDSDNASKNKPVKQGVFFDKLALLLTRANAFGYSITSCDDVEPFTMKDMQLKDNMLPSLIGSLLVFIIVMKFISYFIVDFCIKLKL